jgi:hypothetical protein
MAATYEFIASQSASGLNVTFTSIPQTYTDLVLVMQLAQTSGSDGVDIRVGNGTIDTGNNYGWRALNGSNSTASTQVVIPYPAYEGGLSNSTTWSSIEVNLLGYTNTNIKKFFLGHGNNTNWSNTSVRAGYWDNTAAINTIRISNGGGVNQDTAGKYTLYGIKAA